MSAQLPTDSYSEATIETPTDNRRITEHDPRVVALKAKVVRKLQASVKQLLRDLRPGSGIAQGEAQSQFIHRHVDILRSAYIEAHRMGQRQYFDGVSREPARWARMEPDAETMAQTMAFYAPSVAKMAHQAAVFAAAANVQQAIPATSHVAALSDLALRNAQGHSGQSVRLNNPYPRQAGGRFGFGPGHGAQPSGRMGSRQAEGAGHVEEHVGDGHHAGGGAGGSGGSGGMNETFDAEAHRAKYGVDYGRFLDKGYDQGTGRRRLDEPLGKELARVTYDHESHTFRFDPPGEESYAGRAYPNGAGLHWVKYDAKTGEFLHEGESTLTRPTDVERAAWDREAKYLANKWHGKLDDLNEENHYIRFGRLPPGGKSRNAVNGKLERGVSVYHAKYDLRSGMIHLDEEFVHDPGAALMAALTGRKAFLVTGKRLGYGSDGEPVLGQTRILKKLEFDPVSGGFKVSDG